ncbi:hypothetical protein SAMN05421858_0312 [Haladaptatus litoreus]|uniref:Uncharacterized protein n=1 Tax=Haladaptatus litoreus TaxID=553468 RepID=A0A1N6VDL9_9EURY|nr:hypothetical protein [Haladaptatus litoreus]SIQ75867.1 hypothetical protein SAMN05421858_0312 [Haladaptatus litoreus]
MEKKNDRTSRRDVLKLSGTTLAAMSGLSVMGSASADMPCSGCDDGGGGGGGGGSTGSPPAAPRTGHYTVTNGEVELGGWSNGDGGNAWFEWGEQGVGFPHDTELRQVGSYETFTGNPVGEESGVTYEYRAVLTNAYGKSEGFPRTFSF